ncbi:hypothetical protein TNCV_898281 [Trichonephila clavipes]|nr:hypothetical protein TNCV_898281 [Trichonephila clavipes]
MTGLKETGSENLRIARHMSRSDVAIRRCWQEWRLIDRYQPSDVRPTYECPPQTAIERNLPSYRPLRHLPFMPARCRARLQWFLARGA